MNGLLNSSESRRIQFVELLSQSEDWTSLSDLSKTLNTSVRVLKEDLFFFKNHLPDFTTESSQGKVRLIYKQNKGIKNIYQQLLGDSATYRLLEGVFLNEYASMSELEEAMFVSASTLYRLIRQINEVFAVRDIQIETNPYRITGNEDNIRTFYYQYFYEKYSFIQWPFGDIEEKSFEDFLKYHIQLTQLNNDFAYFSKLKMIVAVNLTRFKQGHYVNIDHINIDLKVKLADFGPFALLFEEFEENFDIRYDEFAMKQLFTYFIKDNFSVDFNHLVNKSIQDEQVAKEIAFLNQLLDDLAIKHHIPIPNKPKMISALRNIIHLDYLEPQNDFTLYSHDNKFAADIKKKFPDFYDSLYDAAKELRSFIGRPLTEEGINFYIYTIFTYWGDVVVSLRKQKPDICLMIISKRQLAHANMIKEYLAFESPKNYQIEIYDQLEFSPDILEDLPCDLIITDFTIPDLATKKTIFIKEIPSNRDLKKIQDTVYQILLNKG